MLKKRLILLASVFGVASPIQAQFFTNFPANPAVLRVGPGQNAGALNNAATAVQIQTYLGNSVFQAAPTSFVDFNSSGTNRLTISGSATSEGNLTNSVNQSLITLAGYDADAGTAAIVGTTTVNRLAASVQVTGINSIGNPTVNVGQLAYTGNNIRSAVSDNGTNFWTGGTSTTTGGVRHLNTNTQVSGTTTNVRSVDIYAGQLFGTTSSGTTGSGVNLIGSGLPTTGPGSFTPYIVTSAPGSTGGAIASPYEYALTSTDRVGASVTLDGLGLGIAYISDDRSSANGGGVQKWAWDGTAWVLQYTFSTITGGTDLAGARGLSGYYDSTLGANVLYATNAAGTGLFQIVDTGSTATFELLASAGTGNAFRGVALVAVPEPTTYALVGLTMVGVGGAMLHRRRQQNQLNKTRSHERNTVVELA